MIEESPALTHRSTVFTKGDRVRPTLPAIRQGLAKAGDLGTVEHTSRGRGVKIRIDGHEVGTYWSVSFWERVDGDKKQIFIGRDDDGCLVGSSSPLVWNDQQQAWIASSSRYALALNSADFPEIKPGELYEAELILVRKV